MRKLACLAMALAACARAPRAETPEQAWAALADAVHDPALAGTFEALDLTSRWAVMSIHRSEREMHALVAARYPAAARSREMARTRDAAEAEQPADYFVRQFHARLEALRPALQATPRFERADDGRTATAIAADGTRQPFARDDDGHWGWSGLRDELQARKDWAANALASVRESARRYAK